jgi:hypothetical protein
MPEGELFPHRTYIIFSTVVNRSERDEDKHSKSSAEPGIPALKG